MKRTILSLLMISLGITSCATYSCPAPDGKACKRVAQVYKEETAELNPPPIKKDIESGLKNEEIVVTKKSIDEHPSLYDDQTPLWIPPKKMRLWISRWVDNKGNYHQPGYMYIEVAKGKWAADQAEVDEMIIDKED